MTAFWSRSLRLSVLAPLTLLSPARGGIDAGDTVVYELGAATSFSRGCYPPCRCALSSTPGVEGTFGLRLVEAAPAGQVYEVAGVDWSVPASGGDPVRVRGSGTYTIDGESPPGHRLELDLTVGDETPVRFDSGLVPGGGEFPRLTIAVSVNGMVCFDTVFDLDAAPRRPAVSFVRGNCNADGVYDLSDPVRLLLALFAGAAPPPCADACDANDDGALDISDAVFALAGLFLGGAAPLPPYPACGADPKPVGPDALDCAGFAPCV